MRGSQAVSPRRCENFKRCDAPRRVEEEDTAMAHRNGRHGDDDEVDSMWYPGRRRSVVQLEGVVQVVGARHGGLLHVA